MSNNKRLEIHELTRLKILWFLRMETFATEENLAIALNKDRGQINRLISKMCQEKLLLKSEHIEGLGRQKRTLIGSTRQGLVYFYVNSSLNQLEEDKVFFPSRIGSLDKVRHKLGIQYFKALCLSKIGWDISKKPIFSTPSLSTQKPVPDLILHLRQDGRADFCVEYERVVKSEKRYIEILKAYADQSKYVIYLFEDVKTMKFIGSKLARLMPLDWRTGAQRLLFGLHGMLDVSCHHFEWGDGEDDNYYIYSGLSTLNCMLAQEVLKGNYAFFQLDYARHKFYIPNQIPDYKLYGAVDNLGNVVPNISPL